MGGPEPESPRRRGLAGLIMGAMWRFAPKHAAAAERESREWFVICRNCGHERTYAEIGGIRYGAYSKGKRMCLRCPACGERRWHDVERRTDQETSAN